VPNQASKDTGRIFKVSVYITNLSVYWHAAYRRHKTSSVGTAVRSAKYRLC